MRRTAGVLVFCGAQFSLNIRAGSPALNGTAPPLAGLLATSWFRWRRPTKLANTGRTRQILEVFGPRFQTITSTAPLGLNATARKRRQNAGKAYA